MASPRSLWTRPQMDVLQRRLEIDWRLKIKLGSKHILICRGAPEALGAPDGTDELLGIRPYSLEEPALYVRRRGCAAAALQAAKCSWTSFHAVLVCPWHVHSMRRRATHWVRRLLAVQKAWWLATGRVANGGGLPFRRTAMRMHRPVQRRWEDGLAAAVEACRPPE